MADIKASLAIKAQDLQKAIDDANALITSPDTSPEDAKAAMEAVTKIQSDIENLKTLEKAMPTPAQSPVSDSQAAQPEPVKPETPATAVSDIPADDSKRDLMCPDCGTTCPDGSTTCPQCGADLTEARDVVVINADDDDEDKEQTPADDSAQTQNMEGRSMPVKIEKTTVSAVTETTDKMTTEQFKESRSALNTFLHTKGEKRDGLTSVDSEVVIPLEIIYDPSIEIEVPYDLLPMANNHNVTTAKGDIPYLAKPNQRMYSVKELEANPELAKPKFENAEFSIETYRGIIPISNESIEDAVVDLVGIVTEHVKKLEKNTTNHLVADILASASALTTAVTDVSLIKYFKNIVNQKLDIAYQKGFVMTQSAFDKFDGLTDTQGRFYLQENVTNETGKTFLGKPLVVVEDTEFGAGEGSAQVFVGDIQRFVVVANRKQITLQWIPNNIYGRILEASIRIDVVEADKNAGYLVTIGAATAPEAVVKPTSANTKEEIYTYLIEQGIEGADITLTKTELLALIPA